MSFSGEIKKELSQLNHFKNKQEVYIELLGYLVSKNVSVTQKSLRFSTENEYNINRFAKLLSNLNEIPFQIKYHGKAYIITMNRPKQNSNLLENMDLWKEEEPEKLYCECQKNENLAKAYIRGCFLGGGTITNPNQYYHLEIKFKNISTLELVNQILQDFSITGKTLLDKKVFYMKDGEEISKFLAFIGANRNVIRYEEIRVMREMKNNVNRLVNCETANLNKTIDAAVEQLALIKKIKKAKKFHLLPDDLKEVAILREKNPNATLAELGNMLTKPISKSSINHRFKKMEKITEEW